MASLAADRRIATYCSAGPDTQNIIAYDSEPLHAKNSGVFFVLKTKTPIFVVSKDGNAIRVKVDQAEDRHMWLCRVNSMQKLAGCKIREAFCLQYVRRHNQGKTDRSSHCD